MTVNNIEEQLLKLIGNAIQRQIVNLHTAIPGIIDSFDPATLTASVQVAIKRQLSDGGTETIEVLPKVPVVYPRSDGFSFYYPIKSGDTVQLIFNERGLDNFKLGSGSVEEPSKVPRFHSYMDAVAIPSLVPFNKGLTNFNLFRRSDTASFIAHAGGFLGIDSDGKIYLGKEDGTENEPLVLGDVLLSALGDLYDKFANLMDNAINAFNAISTGPVGIGNLGAPVPTDAALATTLANISTAITTLKTQTNADKAKYVTAPATNIVSQIAFTERGP